MEATMSDGFTTDWKPIEEKHYPCRTCGSHEIEYREWEDDAGHLDYQYRCRTCDHIWWAEGTDA
jgi:predicted SprT family Zn-dependent metalloprotease